MVHDGGGGKSRPSLPCCFRGMVPKSTVAGMVDQANSGHPPYRVAGPWPHARSLDVLHDEHACPQYGSCLQESQVLPEIGFEKH